MNRKLRMGLIALLAVVFMGSGAAAIRQAIQYRQGEQTYQEAAEMVNLPDLTVILPKQPVLKQATPQQPAVSSQPVEDPAVSEEPVEEEPVWVDPYADALRNMDFAALREANGDVLGWIVIPNTNLSYPLVQGEDNDYYLNRTWRKGSNSVGAIFMDYRNSWSLGDFHTIIYGHRMNDRSMFGQLHKYKDAAYWEEHPCVYIADDSGSHTYEIFAAYEADSGATYMLDVSSMEQKQAFLDYCQSKSVLTTGVIPTVNDQILTLSTCTGNGHDTRWVVQAVRRGAEEVPAEEVSSQEKVPAKEETPAPEELPAQPEPPPSQDIKVPLEELLRA